MSNKSNNYGRGYEYACITTLQEQISKQRKATIVENNSFDATLRAWEAVPKPLQETMLTSAMAVTQTLFELEPMILEKSTDELELLIQKDERGEEGDVRDILIIRSSVKWEIGISIKHNSFSLKHSRLARELDFGAKWYGVTCSNKYWQDINPVFDLLDKKVEQGAKWREVSNKWDKIYVPLLTAFMNEIKRQYDADKSIVKRLAAYLLGEFDLYKVISIDRKHLTLIQVFNIYGTLGKPSNNEKPKVKSKQTPLPNRIISLDFKPKSKTTLELYLEGGWLFTFRLHSAETLVHHSLKFDVQLRSRPLTILEISCKWGE